MEKLLNNIRQIRSDLDELENYFIGRQMAADLLRAAFDFDKESNTYVLLDDTDPDIVMDLIEEQAARKEETLPTKKEGSITKRKDGLWHGKYYAEGIRKNVYARTKKELIAKMNKAVSERDRAEKSQIATKKTTLNKWVQTWLETKKERKQSTIDDYRYNLQLKVSQNSIGKKAIGNITSLDIERFLQGITHKATRAKTYRHLRSCFEYARKHKVISENPFDTVEAVPLPKANHYNPTQADVDKLLNYMKDQNYQMYLFGKFISLTGLRKGEALALEWKDITDYIVINKAYESHSQKTQTPKTPSSFRRVPLFPEAKAVLSEVSKKGSLVFAAIYKNAITHRWRVYTKHLGLDGLTIHSLRHFFATQCYEAGVSNKVVQAWLGHSNYAMTDFYTYINTLHESEQIDKVAQYRAKDKK